tara:strand:+ start:189 stop:518 length:330 start_codon:yes stop_codon:yes gene_type:complete
MEIIEIGKLGASVIVGGLLVTIIFWLLKVHLPQQRNDFLKALDDERELHKGINRQLQEEIKTLQQYLTEMAGEIKRQNDILNRLVTVLVSAVTSNGNTANQVAEQLLGE